MKTNNKKVHQYTFNKSIEPLRNNQTLLSTKISSKENSKCIVIELIRITLDFNKKKTCMFLLIPLLFTCFVSETQQFAGFLIQILAHPCCTVSRTATTQFLDKGLLIRGEAVCSSIPKKNICCFNFLKVRFAQDVEYIEIQSIIVNIWKYRLSAFEATRQDLYPASIFMKKYPKKL